VRKRSGVVDLIDVYVGGDVPHGGGGGGGNDTYDEEYGWSSADGDEDVDFSSNSTSTPTGAPTYEEEGGGGGGGGAGGWLGGFRNARPSISKRHRHYHKSDRLFQGANGGGDSGSDEVESYDSYDNDTIADGAGLGFDNGIGIAHGVSIGESVSADTNETSEEDGSRTFISIDIHRHRHTRSPRAISVGVIDGLLDSPDQDWEDLYEPTEIPSGNVTVVPTVKPTTKPFEGGVEKKTVVVDAIKSKDTPDLSEFPSIMSNVSDTKSVVVDSIKSKDTPDLPDVQKKETQYSSFSPSQLPSAYPILLSNATATPSAKPTTIPTAVPADVPDVNEKKQPALKFERDMEKAKPKKSSQSDAPVELKVTMFDDSGEGWFREDYEGTMFYITDESKRELLAYGTLENGTYSAYCEYCMGEGSYYFRVGAGTEVKDVKWNFCGVNGSYSQQLAFHIDSGVCVPDALLDLGMLCEDTVSSVVTVSVRVALHGLQTEMFGAQDASVLISALSEVVPGLEAEQIEFESSTLSLHTMSRGSRALNSFSVEVGLTAYFVPEIAFQYSGTSYNGVKELVSYLEEVLKVSSSTGELSSVIRTLSTQEHDVQMSHVSQTEVLGLTLSEITYVGTKSLSYGSRTIDVRSEAVEHSEILSSDERMELVASFNGYHAAIFGAILSIGFVAFIGILVQSLRSRTQDNLPSRYVSYSDIDLSISNHYQSQNSGSRSPTVSL